MTERAKVNGVSVDLASFIASNESGYDPKARGDLSIICHNKNSPYDGQATYARGIWQITRCWHPEVTDEQADSVEWSTAWAMERLPDKKMCKQEWTTCRAFYTSK